MIEVLTNYVRNISIFIIFITFIGIILPSEKYKGYINLVLGLVLIMIFLKPVSEMISFTDSPYFSVFSEVEEGFNKEALEEQSKLYSEHEKELIIKNMNIEIKKQIVNIMDRQDDFDLVDAKIHLSDEMSELTGIEITVAEKSKKPEKNKLVRIEPVKINKETTEERFKNEDKKESEINNLKNLISDFYILPKENIYINIQMKSGE